MHDAANPAEVIRDVIAFATAGRPPEEREQIIQMIHEGAKAWAVHNFTSGCEVGDMLAARLGFDPAVRDALGFTFERWNGAGYPNHASGEEIPLAMRVVHLSHDMEAHGRLFSPDEALEVVRDRRGPHLRPRAGGPLRGARGGVVRPARHARALGRGARARAASRTAPWTGTSSTRPSRSSPTSST